MQLWPGKIRPSQNFLKESTIKYIFECLRTGKLEQLPPPPLVRKAESGELVAIDGHNLIAVRAFRGEPVEVHLTSSADDGLAPTSKSNLERNQELKTKYDVVLIDSQDTKKSGIDTFDDLVAKYQRLFEAESKL